MPLPRAAMETSANCREWACHDDITLGATGEKPGSENTKAPKTTPATSNSLNTAATTALNTQDTQERNTSRPAATTMPAASPAPSMFRSEVISSWDPAAFWMKLIEQLEESVLPSRVTMETPANNCPEKGIPDDVTLGVPSNTLRSPPEPGSKTTKAPNSIPASNNSSDPAAISKAKALTTPPNLSTPPAENYKFIRSKVSTLARKPLPDANPIHPPPPVGSAPIAQPTSAPAVVGTGGDPGQDQKESHLGLHCRPPSSSFSLPKKSRPARKRSPSPSEDESRKSSDSDSYPESGDRWAKTQREANQERDWELASNDSLPGYP
ncbi:hypothetical protein TURU_112102 [Turdus rufiventris]|nr:hypothetical protein TURU_112102 [Turdus rufiventris]